MTAEEPQKFHVGTYVGTGLLAATSCSRSATGPGKLAGTGLFQIPSAGNKYAPGQTSYLDGRFGELLANGLRCRRGKPVTVLKRVDHDESHVRDGMGRYSAIPPPGPLFAFAPLFLVACPYVNWGATTAARLKTDDTFGMVKKDFDIERWCADCSIFLDCKSRAVEIRGLLAGSMDARNYLSPRGTPRASDHFEE